MSTKTKISPAFEPFLADSGEDDKREAIVIYKAPKIENLPLRGRLRELKRRLDEVKAEAKQEKQIIEQRIVTHYTEASGDLDYTQTVTRTPRAGRQGRDAKGGTLTQSFAKLRNTSYQSCSGQPGQSGRRLVRGWIHPPISGKLPLIWWGA